MNKVIIIFICHDNNSISSIMSKNYNFNFYILFVGNKEIDSDFKNNNKIVVCRELNDNIELEEKLLTFTAWYAIIKNNLFLEYEYLCILEYDVQLEINFYEVLEETIEQKYPVLSFEEADKKLLFVGINSNIMKKFIVGIKKINLSIISSIGTWGCSTNQCMLRDILNEFVNWYYPDYIFIKKHDIRKLSYYHERLFMIFLKNKNINYYKVNGLQHEHKRSYIIKKNS